MNNEELKQQLVELLIKAHITMSPHSVADYLITNNVQVQKTARWIPASTKPGIHAGMKCSECKARISYSEHFNGQHLYCHKCGAKMVKEKAPEYTFTTYAGIPGYEATDKE
jgi:DNA-directed RNA polymerase subunit RPC12/RpoP